jgi:hypothetical protein
LDKPAKSPYHHLIPEVREQRRRRNWYILLALTGLVFLWIAYNLWRSNQDVPGASRDHKPIRAVLDKAVTAP